jgi:hydroxypyruvate isomerase
MSLKQSVSWWCFERDDIDVNALMATVDAIGYDAVELVPEEKFQLVTDYGLRIVTHGLHRPLEQGVAHTKYWHDIQAQADKNLSLAVKWGIPNLIVFSGNREGLDAKRGAENAIKQLEMLAKDAESAGVMLILELLNSKVDHPDYMCDNTAWGVEVVSAVNSPNLRLLYDIYHMQVMEGDIIQAIRDHHQWFGHYHTAGVPGRNEIDASQELNYSAICEAIVDTGYQGYLGQEFIPLNDWKQSLKQAYDICNV